MEDPVEPPLADDPNFLEGLDDLDRGLGDDAAPRAPRQPVHRAPQATPRSESVPAPTASSPIALPPLNLPPAPPGAVRHRPLLDLFPPVPTAGERRPAPFFGQTSDPQPAAVTVAVASAPEVPTPALPAARPYEAFYGLREPPFGSSTDPRFYFPSTEHERVADALVAAIHARQAATLLIGEPGVGKTTLCSAVVRRLDRRTVSSLVLEPVASADDLITRMLVDFGVVERDEFAAGAIPHESLVVTLRSFVDSLAPLRAAAVVVLDDAENQPTEVLDLLGRLIDRADGAPAALQTVLVGLPSITARLSDEPRLQALSAAIATRVALGPLAAADVAGYINHRLSVAAATSPVRFEDDAVDRIVELSRGIPGVVNLIADRALTAASQRSARTIDRAIVDAVAAPLNVAAPVEPRSSRANLLVAAVLVAGFLLGGVGAALWLFRDDVARTLKLWENVPAAPAEPVPAKSPPLRPIPPPADGAGPSADNLSPRSRI